MNTSAQISNAKLKGRLLKDKLFTYTLIFLAFLSSVPLFLILFELIKKGYKQINLSFFYKVAPDTMEAMVAVKNNEIIPGGIANGIVGTLIIVGMASLIAIPVGIICGMYLSENSKGKFAGVVRFIVDMLQWSSIHCTWCYRIHLGGETNNCRLFRLSRKCCPFYHDVAIHCTLNRGNFKNDTRNLKGSRSFFRRSLSQNHAKSRASIRYQRNSYGCNSWDIKNCGRETAPLMLTALGSAAISTDITEPSSAIPLLVWEFYNDPNLVDMIWSASLFLLILILCLNLTAKAIAKRWKVQY